MKLLQTLLLAALVFLGAALASDVLDLTADNFDSTLQANPVILVEFFAPWCGHCKTLAPKFEQAATQLKGIAPIAKVDCTAQESVCSRFGVRGYPTLKLFRDGTPTDYNSAREVEALVSYMKKQVLPAVSILKADNIQEFSQSDKVVVIGFFNDESKEFKIFSEVAQSLRDDYTFGAITDASVFAQFNVETAPAVILFKKFDEGKNVFEEAFSKGALAAFVKTNAIPTMDDIGPQNYQTFMESGLPLAYLFITPENRNTVGPLVETVAKEFKGKMNFVYIDANQYGGHASNVNLKVGEWPAFSVHKPNENTKFPFSGQITTEAIRQHVAGILDGSIVPSVKSQAIPTEQGNVKVVVGKNYDEIVNKSGKDVLIEFYAPWCGHCKKLTPVYDELGEFYANNPNIIIAKMDATENDLPADTPFQVQGFPTIKFIKADGTIVSYEGDRSLDDFKEFIESNASVRGSGSASGSTKDEL